MFRMAPDAMHALILPWGLRTVPAIKPESQISTHTWQIASICLIWQIWGTISVSCRKSAVLV
jgi:hypothetical protein